MPRLPPAVVLVRPREEGNVGAAARAMANMGLDRLILVEPAAEIGGVARAFAVGAGGIGLKLIEAMRTNQDWENVAYMVMLILLVVFLFDNLSTALRQRLIGAPGSDRH